MAATLLAAAILAGVGVGAYWWRQDAADRGQGGTPSRRRASPLVNLTLTPDTRLVERTRYPACGEAVLETERPPTPVETGWRLSDLLRSRDTWRLAQATPDRIVLERQRPGPCPPAAWLRYRTVRLHEGHVAVFYGRPGRQGRDLGPLRLLTDLPAERLLPGDRRRLEQGLVVEGDGEAWHVLESLTP